MMPLRFRVFQGVKVNGKFLVKRNEEKVSKRTGFRMTKDGC